MARVVYLHVGAPKTGTTYLQDRLANNKSSLAEHDIAYPTGLHTDMFGAALDLIDMPWGGQRDGVRGEWEALAGRVRRANGTVIVTHEILAGAKRPQIKKAIADLGDTELHLVYSARDVARQIPAEWQEEVKHRRRRTFAQYLERAQQAKRRNSSMWFWRAQGLPDVLTRWTAGLPPERVHLVTVPQAGAPQDTLWLRYCQAFAIKPEWAPEPAGRLNVSIGTAETTLVRRLNRRLRRAGLESDQYRALVRQLLVHETLAARPHMRRVTLPPEAFPWANEVADEWVEWVEGSGIDVIGDLDDLRPVAPPAGERWRNPDRPPNRRVADAALDALAAVIVEAAERPDPDAQITARLGRVARRLRS